LYPFKVTSGHCPEGKTEKVDCWPMPEVPNNIDMTVGSLGLTDHEENRNQYEASVHLFRLCQ
jgi:hypothetical protein